MRKPPCKPQGKQRGSQNSLLGKLGNNGLLHIGILYASNIGISLLIHKLLHNGSSFGFGQVLPWIGNGDGLNLLRVVDTIKYNFVSIFWQEAGPLRRCGVEVQFLNEIMKKGTSVPIPGFGLINMP